MKAAILACIRLIAKEARPKGSRAQRIEGDAWNAVQACADVSSTGVLERRRQIHLAIDRVGQEITEQIRQTLQDGSQLGARPPAAKKAPKKPRKRREPESYQISADDVLSGKL